MRSEHLKAIVEAEAAREALVLVTPLSGGAQELVSEDAAGGHAFADDLGGVFRSGRSRIVEKDGGEIFLQAFVPKPRLVVTGATHIAQILVRLAGEVEMESVVIDPRTAFATKERFAGCDLIAEWPAEVLKTMTFDRRSALVCLAHVPEIDDEALVPALASECFYVGALGSKKTHAGRVERLSAAGLGDEQIQRIHAPIGLDIGSLTPNEIALSIIAEAVAVLRAQFSA